MDDNSLTDAQVRAIIRREFPRLLYEATHEQNYYYDPNRPIGDADGEMMLTSAWLGGEIDRRAVSIMESFIVAHVRSEHAPVSRRPSRRQQIGAWIARHAFPIRLVVLGIVIGVACSYIARLWFGL